MKKFFSLLLVLSMLLCSSAMAALEDINANTELPLVEERVTLTVATLQDADMANWEDTWFWKWASEAMNIDFEVIQIPNEDRSTKLNLMFAADELPDIFYNCNLTTSEIAKYGAGEAQLLPLNDLIEQYAPNIKNFYEVEPEVAAATYYLDGNIYMLPAYKGYSVTEYYSSTRAWINQKWLNNLGLENPTTLEEFYNVLTAFKTQDANGNGDANDEYPLSDTNAKITRLMLNQMGVMTSGTSTLTAAIKDGKALIPANDHDFYLEFLTTMNKFYTEGLIHPDMYTMTTTQQKADVANDIIGAHVASAPHSLNADTYEEWTTILPMATDAEGNTLWVGPNDYVHGQFAISYKCENLEAAIKFADWHFTQIGSVYTWFGPEAGSEDLMGIANGWVYDESIGNLVYEGFDTGLQYTKAYTPGVANGVGVRANNEALQLLYGYDVSKLVGAAKYWRELHDVYLKDSYSAFYPVVYFDEATSERINAITTPLSDYVTVMEAKFVTGEEPLENFDAYYEQLQTLNLGELEGYYLAAYDNYLANLK